MESAKIVKITKGDRLMVLVEVIHVQDEQDFFYQVNVSNAKISSWLLVTLDNYAQDQLAMSVKN